MSSSRGAYNVPLALNAEHRESAESRLRRHIADCKGCTIGPMPPDMFLKELLPMPTNNARDRLSSRSAFSGVPQRANSPSRIYVPLRLQIQALNKRTKSKSRCPGLEFVDTYERSRRSTDPEYAKPHICCFTSENANIVRDASSRTRLEFAYTELFFQVASDPAADIFVDPPSDASEGSRSAHDIARKFEDGSIREEAELLYGLHIAYATELSAAKRGLDTTVTLASPHEEATFRDAITEEVRLQLDIDGDELEKAVSAHYLRGHVTIIPITPQQPFDSAEKPHRFIVSRPIVSPLSLAGRGTREFWAVDAVGASIGQNRSREISCANSTTSACPTSPYLQSTATCQWILRYIANQTLRGTEELLYGTHDALTAMKDAYTMDSRIHRDLSVGNIILVKEPDRMVRKGYLIDWEASDRVDDGGEALHAGRAVNGKHTLADDLEALLYVVLYCGLYYLPHNHSIEEVEGVRQQFFEWYIRWPGDILHGGVGKLANAEDRLFTDHLHFESAALDEWLQTVMDFHCRRLGSKEAPDDMWTIDKLDAFWTEFLETHQLERDNRQVHMLSAIESLGSTTNSHTPVNDSKLQPGNIQHPPSERTYTCTAQRFGSDK
ncbi:hypothetical protein PYCCODRAFT_1459093 [Trametes coccinea BRFM310]|uniref:Fungal-type protein kinase domain-containing protein n=1 Tax=Trametes coccinea (strain BRFM310) TaxID=1353009 RepID=A0A1Y2IMR5_TRAC3|nr:hypothetical protein PYCCODRAFT_1459093 [Trametes coccinea BRFM310]